MTAKPCPSQETLKARLNYDRDTGVFTWRENPARSSQWNGRYAGAIAGKICDDGRKVISIDKIMYRASRLAWVYVHGAEPCGEIDHSDMDQANDAISNLRVATSSQNKHNRRGRSGRGMPKGVTVTRSGKYGAQITVNGKHHWLGSFEDIEGATAAYATAAVRLYGPFARAA